ncbi:MAG: hypothetical protein GVY32_03640 [Gammaproteobacteria bacterium]|jgi:hypothetical protein|nr:hypothetical protein [Gammaproteobacteria bacterium]
MKTARILAAAALPWLALVLSAQAAQPVWIDELDSRDLPGIERLDESVDPLLAATQSARDPDEVLAALAAVRADESIPLLEREAILHRYLERLRELPPGTADAKVLDWFGSLAPLAVTGHPEGRHHPVPVFNLVATARGLSNQWAWQAARDSVSGPGAASPAGLAAAFDEAAPNTPVGRGLQAGIDALPASRLEAVALACATRVGGCGHLRADIELARGNRQWLDGWLADAPAAEVLPRLRRAREHLNGEAAGQLMTAALDHPDAGVAAWALNDLTDHLPKDAAARAQWSERLVELLDEPRLGSAAALQLARLKPSRWLLESAAAHPDPLVQRRLELVAEMDHTLLAVEPGRGEP